jgi:hypothetical protein
VWWEGDKIDEDKDREKILVFPVASSRSLREGESHDHNFIPDRARCCCLAVQDQEQLMSTAARYGSYPEESRSKPMER